MDARQQFTPAQNDHLWSFYEAAERKGILQQWLERCSEAEWRGKPEFTQYTFRLFATRLEEQGRPVPQIITTYLASEARRVN